MGASCAVTIESTVRPEASRGGGLGLGDGTSSSSSSLGGELSGDGVPSERSGCDAGDVGGSLAGGDGVDRAADTSSSSPYSSKSSP